MQTVLVWLLISLPGTPGTSSNVPAVKVAAFATEQECARVLLVMGEGRDRRPLLRCIQANVVPGV